MRFPSLRLAARLAAIAPAALGIACDETMGGTLPPADAYVTVGNNFFMPPTTTIRVGQSVLWLWGGGLHDMFFVETGAPADCQQMSVGACTRQFPNAGTFPYVCTLHPGMDGIVQVNP